MLEKKTRRQYKKKKRKKGKYYYKKKILILINPILVSINNSLPLTVSKLSPDGGSRGTREQCE
jgi:hypothetical protein